jgi:N-acetylneuraminic acid mutarotase
MKTYLRSSVQLSLIHAAFILASVPPAEATSWVTNGPLNTPRLHHTATLLPNGKVLAVGGIGEAGYLSSAELYDPATGIWTATGSMTDERQGHTATLLPDGRVLVVGGWHPPNASLSAELYDPATGMWTNTATMNTARYVHTATLLRSGKVLIAGGYGDDGYLSSAELYDPVSGMWTEVEPMNNAHNIHTATVLPDGNVLVTGGGNAGSDYSTAEIYLVSNGTWIPTQSMSANRYRHTATLLPSGKVLVTGGDFQPSPVSAELFDPSSGTWEATGIMSTNRNKHTASLLPNGQLLVTGGHTIGNDVFSSAEIYDPVTQTWALMTNALNHLRYGHTATVLPSGKVLIAGGAGINHTPLSSTEVYDSANGAWATTTPMTATRWHHTATLLPNGQVLVCGGLTNFSVPTSRSIVAELYDPTTATWNITNSMASDHAYHTATLLPNGRVLVTGGSDRSGTRVSIAELFDPATGQWSGTGSLNNGRSLHAATLLRNGKVLVSGGTGLKNGASGSLSSCELYDPSLGSWTVTGPMNNSRTMHTGTLLADGRVLVAGGYDDSNYSYAVSSAELYDPATEKWIVAGSLNTSRNKHTATLLPNGNVLITGGTGNSFPYILSSTELFSPTTETWSFTSPMNNARQDHTSSLLPNGMVLVVAGQGEGSFGHSGVTNTAELYDSVTGKWTLTGTLITKRYSHTTTALANGKLLVAGGLGSGILSSAELFDVGLGFSNSWQPQVTSLTSPLNLGSSLAITGSQFRGISGASSGNTQDSSSDCPLVQLRSIESGQTTFLQTTNWSTNSFTSLPLWNFPPGWAMATVFVNGVPSTSSIVNITVPVPTPPTITDAKKLTNGTLEFAFTNTVGAVFAALASTNVSLPLSNWTALSGITEISPGQFQFTDPQATNSPQRFYRVRAN